MSILTFDNSPKDKFRQLGFCPLSALRTNLAIKTFNEYTELNIAISYLQIQFIAIYLLIVLW